MLAPSDLRRPLSSGWSILVGMDTGTYMSALFVLFPPDSGHCYFAEEFPNYRYVGGEPELLGYSVPEWSREVFDAYRRYRPGVSRLHGWCDENSQFKTELRHYNLIAQGNKRKLELRVEITREYMSHRRAWFAPWLSVLPWEFEHAQWPDEMTSAGKFERLKVDDHTLDCAEHVLSRRPRHASILREKKESFLDAHLRLHRRRDMQPSLDPHLGRL